MTARKSCVLPQQEDARYRYHEIEKLCLYLFFTCTKLRHILLSVEIIVICKSDVIKHMMMAPVLKGRLGKWMFALSEFDIRYQLAQTSSQKELILISQLSMCAYGLCILTDQLVKTDVA
jgi:hypothetical protein